MADHTLLFPEDIIYNILSRLPIKSLARFRCVCKLWLKYINDPYLRTIHVNNEEPTPLMFQQLQLFDPKKIDISFLRGTTSLQKDPVLNLCYKSPYYDIQFLGSCNGLILVCYEQNPSAAAAAAGTFTYRFAVINPLSKRRHNLPPISIKIRSCSIDVEGPCNAAGIGFDDSTNTFKTVFSILKNPYRNVVCTMVHSSRTSSWRKIDHNPAYAIGGGGVFSDGRLHWLTCDNELIEYEYFRKIVWFDVRTEEFGLSMDPPEGCQPDGCDCSFYNQLVDLNGEVGYVYTGPTCMKLWILKHEEWVLHCSFDPSLILPEDHDYDVEVSGCWNKDGDILLTYKGGELLLVYTHKSGDLREVELRHQCEGFTNIRMYQSSLFSVHTSAYYLS